MEKRNKDKEKMKITRRELLRGAAVARRPLRRCRPHSTWLMPPKRSGLG